MNRSNRLFPERGKPNGNFLILREIFVRFDPLREQAFAPIERLRAGLCITGATGAISIGPHAVQT